jgi:6-phosphogluconolactonase
MTTAVYVSNADDGTVSVLALDEAAGTLGALQTLALGGTLMPMALDAARQRLFVARRSEPLAVVTLAIAGDGRLSVIGEGALPASMAYVSLDREGRWLLAASYGDDVVSVSRVGDDGVAAAAHQMLKTGRHAHAIVCDAANRHAFSTALGADAVHQWLFDDATGSLSANPVAPTLAVRAGAGPRHLAWHPDGRTAFLLHELDASLDVLAYDAGEGTLEVRQSVSAMPAGFDGKPWGADVHVHPSGRFVYTSERTSSTIAGFAFDGVALRPIGHWDAPPQPRGFHITANGRWLVVAGQLAQHVNLHSVDTTNGALRLHVRHEVGANPNWVETLELAPSPARGRGLG